MTEKLEAINPATGDVGGVSAIAEGAPVDAAVARARHTAQWWASGTFDERRGVLDQWKSVLTRRDARVARVVQQETGKPHGDAQLEIGLAIEHLAWAAAHAGKVLGPRRVP